MDRLLSGGPEACERIERGALASIKAADWSQARRLLKLRLEMRLRPGAPERQQIDRLLRLIDEAEAKGVGPGPST
jgi:hypothetical protein